MNIKNENSNIIDESGFIDIGDICNAKCYFCFNEEGPLYYSKEHIYLEIDGYIEKGILEIRYGVGEFTMHPNFFEILEYGKNKGIKQYIHTNGIKLSDINFVKKLANLGINNINLSLHGIKSKTNDKILGVKGSFKKVMLGIKNLKKIGIKISISFVITNDNVNEILGIYLFCLKNNISLLKLSFLTGGQKYDKLIIPSLNKVKIELNKVLELNKRFNLKIKMLNISFCLLGDYEKYYIFENGYNSITYTIDECKKCIKSSICSKYPIYYKKEDFISFVRNYVKN